MGQEGKFIVMLGCFDTKGEVFACLRGCILDKGMQVLAINTGVMGTTRLFPVDFEAGQVASEAGETLEILRKQGDRGSAMAVMGLGAARLLARLVAEGKVKGVVGMGGGGGTYITLAAMQEIPFGVPKVCLTTIASKDLSRQVGEKDIMLIPSVVDVAGLNSVIRVLVEQAAAAVCAMSEVKLQENRSTRGRIAISMFGNTTACVDRCTELLTEKGYEVLAFHATGVGGKTMEALIRDGFFDAVLDVTTTELADALCGGICSAGPERMNAAADKKLVQVVIPGCLDMVNFAHRDSVPAPFKNRQLYNWAPDVTLMRTNKEENEALGRILAAKVNRSTAPVAVLLPLAGLSQIDQAGGVFYNPEVDGVLFGAIKAHVGPKVKVIEIEAHINDAEFATLAVETLLDLMQKR